MGSFSCRLFRRQQTVDGSYEVWQTGKDGGQITKGGGNLGWTEVPLPLSTAVVLFARL